MFFGVDGSQQAINFVVQSGVQMQEIEKALRADSEQFVALHSLGLDDQELTVLSRQGYIQRDIRLASGRGYWRLRFRIVRRTRTVYLGTNELFVEQVKRELDWLQSARRRKRKLARAVHSGKNVLRQAKARIVPALAELGFHYHGDSLRKRRRAHKSAGTT